MKVITTKELNNYKILPFDVYANENEKLFSAGEVLTPGKLISLRQYPTLLAQEIEEIIQEKEQPQETGKVKLTYDFDYDSLNIMEINTPINKSSIIDTETQIRIKLYFMKILELLKAEAFEHAFNHAQALVNILEQTVLAPSEDIKKGSQLRFLGEYEVCHPLNVAVFSGKIARRLELDSLECRNVTIAGLLHDIGKLYIEGIKNENSLETLVSDAMKQHVIIGYNLLKQYNMPESVYMAVLEHHENNDGSGYPRGISNDWILKPAQILSVCNYFDNLAFNKTPVHIFNTRDALKRMLELGTAKFAAEILYTFVHMFSYNDTENFENMTTY